MKVSIILGTRPQIIKSAPVYSAFRKEGMGCDIVNTGQHYDYEMNRQFFSELELPDPSADLNIGAGPPNQQVSAIISGLGRHFADEKPDIAIVPGDTNSALAAGIACTKAGVRVAHLEAGCRSGDFRMAEEVNRRLLDHLSQVLLCPTPGCVRNVKAERVLADVIADVGDTMLDSLLKYKAKAEGEDAASDHDLQAGEYIFMTLHRAETVDDAGELKKVLESVGSLGVPVAFSVHPRTRARLKEFGIDPGQNIRILDPLPYLETLALVSQSRMIITDSGGLQKEAYWLGKPALIARDVTEWGEIVEAGAAFLVGTDPVRIERGSRKAERVHSSAFRKSSRIFGNGDASAHVVRAIAKFLTQDRRARS
jgi:UDP-N-acetylglucosamine 2-epimerase